MQQMENAVNIVKGGILSTYATADRYNISRRTLRNHVESGSLSVLTNPTSRENIAVLSTESRGQKISTATAEDSDGSGTDTENWPLYVPLKNNPSTETPHKTDNSITPTREIHEFLPTPTFKTINTTPRKKSLNYKAQEVTKDLFSNNATTSTSQITVPSLRLEAVPGTSSILKMNTNAPKSTAKHRGTKGYDNKLSWYCPACKEYRVDDIRQCLTCGVWYHELCVGLTRAVYQHIFYCSGKCLKKKMKKTL